MVYSSFLIFIITTLAFVTILVPFFKIKLKMEPKRFRKLKL